MQNFDFEGFIASLLRQKYHNVAAKICLNFTCTFVVSSAQVVGHECTLPWRRASVRVSAVRSVAAWRNRFRAGRPLRQLCHAGAHWFWICSYFPIISKSSLWHHAPLIYSSRTCTWFLPFHYHHATNVRCTLVLRIVLPVQIVQKLNFFTQQTTEVETYLVALERIHEYFSIQSEVWTSCEIQNGQWFTCVFRA